MQEIKADIITVAQIQQILADNSVTVLTQEELATKADLVIVVGGDGSFLEAARTCVMANVPMIGVNRGRKGFLTDLSPQAIKLELEPILNGKYIEEQRFLLALSSNDKSLSQDTPLIALNDIVLFNGSVAKMMEFEVSVDGKHVYRQRSDGLIMATPTGSTAYALSGGGPIVHPSLDAIVMVPMHPHTLSNRPIVLPASAKITLQVLPSRHPEPQLSFDGQVTLSAHTETEYEIKMFKQKLRLLHPKDYDYFHTLRSKLSWSA